MSTRWEWTIRFDEIFPGQVIARYQECADGDPLKTFIERDEIGTPGNAFVHGRGMAAQSFMLHLLRELQLPASVHPWAP